MGVSHFVHYLVAIGITSVVNIALYCLSTWLNLIENTGIITKKSMLALRL